jgi:phosphatidylinositol alpha-1,6-mannosyltransferase
VVGEGDDRARLEQLAADLGVAGQVHFVGELTARELAACYRQCDAFVMPSSVEGFGLVFLEAMACGKPVVGGAHGGTTDIIADGQNGYLVPPDEIGRLAEVLEKLIAHDDLRRELGRRGQERVAQNYLFEHFRSRLLRLMDEICAS